MDAECCFYNNKSFDTLSCFSSTIEHVLKQEVLLTKWAISSTTYLSILYDFLSDKNSLEYFGKGESCVPLKVKIHHLTSTI